MKDILEKISYNSIVSALLLIFAAFMLTKLGAALLKKLAERYSHKRIQITTLIPIYKLMVNFSVLAFIGFGIFNISGQTLMALGLSLGVALGFAFQDLLGNIFGGLIIIFTKPFAIGDKIQIGEHYGEVKDISLRRLEIVTIDDSVISIPNKAILTEHVSNANTGELNCQVVTDIFLPLDVDFNKAR
ncbi:MAG: mechanosensitive ion channel protein MscS, partial [Spirochaetae bacterium HGW-Spirochaetae-6]